MMFLFSKLVRPLKPTAFLKIKDDGSLYHCLRKSRFIIRNCFYCIDLRMMKYTITVQQLNIQNKAFVFVSKKMSSQQH